MTSLSAAGKAVVVEQGARTVSNLTQAFSDADITSDGKISKNEFDVFCLMQGNLGLTSLQLDRLYILLSSKDALSEVDSFISAAISSSGYDANGKIGASHHVEIYVPSTTDIDKIIDESVLEKRVKEVAIFLTHIFHGASAAAPTMGYYKTDAGVLVMEKTVKVYSFTTLDLLNEKRDEVMTFAQKIASTWSQECIALVIDGTMHFVYQDNTDNANEMNDIQLMNTFFTRVRRYSDIETIAEGVKARKVRSPTKH